jgi:transketolase
MRKPNVRAFATLISPFPVFWVCQDLVLIPAHPAAPEQPPLVYTLWNRVMRFDPQDPIWPNRDRFVLSNGHASMLLWSVLHRTGTRAVNAAYERLGRPAVSAVEQASTFGWERYVSKSGRVIGIKTFGASAPLKELQRKFGFEPERATEIAKELIGKCDTR